MALSHLPLPRADFAANAHRINTFYHSLVPDSVVTRRLTRLSGCLSVSCSLVYVSSGDVRCFLFVLLPCPCRLGVFTLVVRGASGPSPSDSLRCVLAWNVLSAPRCSCVSTFGVGHLRNVRRGASARGHYRRTSVNSTTQLTNRADQSPCKRD